MKTSVLLLVLWICTFSVIAQDKSHDYDYLRDGTKYYGDIAEMKSVEFVRINVYGESIRTYPNGVVDVRKQTPVQKERRGRRKVLCEITRLNSYIHFNAELRSLKGDTLIVDLSGIEFAIPLESIVKIRHKRRSHVGLGIAFGALIGGAVGAIHGYETSEDGFLFSREDAAIMTGSMGAAGGMLAGALIGLAAGKDGDYDLSNLDIERKRFIIEKMLSIR
jgi:hypothetical protein